MVKYLPTMRETWVQFLGWEDLLEKEMATHSSILAWKIPWREEPGKLQSMQSQSQTRLSNFTSILHQRDQEGFLSGTSGKESACQCMRHKRSRLDPWVGKIPWRRKCKPLQYSCWENPTDRGAWWATVHGVTESTQLSN